MALIPTRWQNTSGWVSPPQLNQKMNDWVEAFKLILEFLTKLCPQDVPCTIFTVFGLGYWGDATYFFHYFFHFTPDRLYFLRWYNFVLQSNGKKVIISHLTSALITKLYLLLKQGVDLPVLFSV